MHAGGCNIACEGAGVAKLVKLRVVRVQRDAQRSSLACVVLRLGGALCTTFLRPRSYSHEFGSAAVYELKQGNGRLPVAFMRDAMAGPHND